MRQADILSKSLRGEKGLKSIDEFHKTEADLKKSILCVINDLKKRISQAENIS